MWLAEQICDVVERLPSREAVRSWRIITQLLGC
jgi:hypothetical protein